MKTSIIFADGLTQINFTPETDNEKMALRLITADQQLEVAVQNGTFMDKHQQKPFTASINKCRGGYLRTFTDQESKMIVLKPRVPEPKERPEIDIRECLMSPDEFINAVSNGMSSTTIHRQAKEIKMMLGYWDDKKFTDNPSGYKVKEMNTTKVLKSFLDQLIKQFSDNNE